MKTNNITICLEISRFITILCHVGFTIVSDRCSQHNFPFFPHKFPIISHKDKAFQGNKYQMNGGYLVGEDTNLFHYLIFVIKK